MLSAIHLDYEALVEAGEVNDVIANGRLPAEVMAELL